MKDFDGLMLFIVFLLLYSVLYDWASRVDKDHCEEHKMFYGGTSPYLDAHCVTPQGVRIRAALVGNEQWKEGE